MPNETELAVNWAIKQLEEVNRHDLVDKVREYFNENKIEYGTFSFSDLKSYL